MRSSLVLLATLFLAVDLTVCYHPPKTAIDDNSIPLSQVPLQSQINPQLITREECANRYGVNVNNQHQQVSSGVGSSLPAYSPLLPPYSPIPGVSSPLPLPVINSYVDNRYVNILPPLPKVAGVNHYAGPVLQNPVVPRISGSVRSDQSPQLGNDGIVFEDTFPRAGLPLGPPSRQVIVRGLEVVHQWKYLDWVYPSAQLTGKNFTLGNPLSQDVDIDRRGRIFVTSPQWLSGVPVTLSTLTSQYGPGGPLLTPYPNWEWHRPGCENLVSVYRVLVTIPSMRAVNPFIFFFLLGSCW
ncbi:uncharacterized protein LOC106641477 [Copidosoma floridanum]|uniref:uncharacterized protein LOC106641477 n=1 Tax=Copidosoma floridanum TaxID=29053 RepID=UPI000C6F66BE|nr:uncharacterized protein LOC106641477 [Copidosoma floridanum]